MFGRYGNNYNPDDDNQIKSAFCIDFSSVSDDNNETIFYPLFFFLWLQCQIFLYINDK